MDISFKHLEVLQAVVTAGSISRATRLLGLSQPTISQQLSRFEEEIGTALIYRRRGARLQLTPAGEFWWRAATDLLSRREDYTTRHREEFGAAELVVRFGVTPSLRGQFIQAAARIAHSGGEFAGFEHVFAVNSVEVLQMIETHNLNCGVVSANELTGHASGLHVTELFRNRSVWAVPASVGEDEVVAALGGRGAPVDGPLSRYVRMSVRVPWEDEIEGWYRAHLPGALPYFRCMTHETGLEYVAAGLCTAHTPLSLLPYIRREVRDAVRFYEVETGSRAIVLVMARHLMSLRPFQRFGEALEAFARETYGQADDGGHRFPPAPMGGSTARSNEAV